MIVIRKEKWGVMETRSENLEKALPRLPAFFLGGLPFYTSGILER